MHTLHSPLNIAMTPPLLAYFWWVAPVATVTTFVTIIWLMLGLTIQAGKRSAQKQAACGDTEATDAHSQHTKGKNLKALILETLTLSVSCCLLSLPLSGQNNVKQLTEPQSHTEPVKSNGAKSLQPKSEPNPIVWQVNANCDDYHGDPHRWCQLLDSKIHLGADGTPYDQWNLIVEAPAPVTGVICETTGSNEFHFLQYKQSNKPQRIEGDRYGNVAICRGWINGGKAPIRITVTYAQPPAKKSKSAQPKSAKPAETKASNPTR